MNDGNNEAFIVEWQNASNVLMDVMNNSGWNDQTIQHEWKRQENATQHSQIYTNDQQMKFSNTFIQAQSFASRSLARFARFFGVGSFALLAQH